MIQRYTMFTRAKNRMAKFQLFLRVPKILSDADGVATLAKTQGGITYYTLGPNRLNRLNQI